MKTICAKLPNGATETLLHNVSVSMGGYETCCRDGLSQNFRYVMPRLRRACIPLSSGFASKRKKQSRVKKVEKHLRAKERARFGDDTLREV
jgi:hypothetical protein